jgi:hypothetical protein
MGGKTSARIYSSYNLRFEVEANGASLALDGRSLGDQRGFGS